jgi:hypothetical protein
MFTLNPEQWLVLSPYLDQALSLSEGEREAWLRSIGERDSELATQLAGLLEEHRHLAENGFLENGLSACRQTLVSLGTHLGHTG